MKNLTIFLAMTVIAISSLATGSSGAIMKVTTTYYSPDITQISATAGGSISSSGGGANVTQRGVCYSTTPNPTIADPKVTSGSGAGSFTCSLTGLTANTTYYIRAYATKSTGTTYGNQLSFTTLANPTYGSMTDNDGNTYITVTIGAQTWMMQNLKTTKYSNGDGIPNVTDNATWQSLSTATVKGAYCNYNNDLNNVATYGRLYNFYAVSDARNLAPDGWHVATKADWNMLETYLGGTTKAGRKMKEVGTVHWYAPNLYSDNISGFTALPAGHRLSSGGFANITTQARFWSSSMQAGNAYFRTLEYTNEQINWPQQNDPDHYRLRGHSVRCVMDSPAKASGYDAQLPGVAAMKSVLHQNYPNPFNPTTTISYALPTDGMVHLRVFDGLGRAVVELVNGTQTTGAHSVVFDARNLPSGMYFYRLEANEQILIGIMTLMK